MLIDQLTLHDHSIFCQPPLTANYTLGGGAVNWVDRTGHWSNYTMHVHSATGARTNLETNVLREPVESQPEPSGFEGSIAANGRVIIAPGFRLCKPVNGTTVAAFRVGKKERLFSITRVFGFFFLRRAEQHDMIHMCDCFEKRLCMCSFSMNVLAAHRLF